MDRPLITWQGVDAAHGDVSRLGAAVEGSHPAKRPPSCAYKALSRSPLCRSIFSLTLSSCAFRYSFEIYSFPRVDQRPDFDGVHAVVVRGSLQFRTMENVRPTPGVPVT